jgi:hypothetical protein
MLQVIDPARPREPLEVPLKLAASGRYEAELSLDRKGSYLLRGVLRHGKTDLGEATGYGLTAR